MELIVIPRISLKNLQPYLIQQISLIGSKLLDLIHSIAKIVC